MKYFAKDPLRSIQSAVNKSVEYYRLKTICSAMNKTVKHSIKEGIILYLKKNRELLESIKDKNMFEQFKIIAEHKYHCQKGSLYLATIDAINLWFQHFKQNFPTVQL